MIKLLSNNISEILLSIHHLTLNSIIRIISHLFTKVMSIEINYVQFLLSFTNRPFQLIITLFR